MTHPIAHHPDAATLLSFAAASLVESLAAVVACHVAMCPACRAEVADLELVGAALLTSKPTSATRPVVRTSKPRRPGSDSDLLVHADRQAHAPTRAYERLPSPIAAAYGLSLAQVPWRRLGPGIWQHRLALQQPEDGDLRLLRIAPGRAMPDHGHGGTELTLVIEGAYSDVTGEYRRGDIQDVDEHIEHKPVVNADAECICLIASEHPARFKGLVGRLLQPWTGM